VPVTLFEAGAAGYRGYRIPALVMSTKGTLLAFCAARKELGDWADIDIAMRRSTDGGKTWSPMKIIADRGSMTVDNPTPIVDRKTGAIHFVFQVNYAQVFYMRSDDDGSRSPNRRTSPMPRTTSAAAGRPRNRTASTAGASSPPDRATASNSPAAGWSFPVWLSPHYRHRPSVTSTLYSDDHGKTWKAGALIPQDAANPLVNPSEHVLVELADGRVMTNLRNEGKERRRAVSVSPDGISNWAVPALHEELFEAVCMASLVRVGSRLVFANPATLCPQRSDHPREPGRRPDVVPFQTPAGRADRLQRYGHRPGRQCLCPV
jgi:sialidase-1